AVHQSARLPSGVRKAVQAPAATDDADLEEQPSLGVFAGRCVALREMKEPLLRPPIVVRPENNFPSKRFGASKRMDIDEDRVIDSIELHRLTGRRFDDTGMAEQFRGMAAEAVETIESPGFNRWFGRG